MLVACVAAVLSFAALSYCAKHGMLLLFGDAVAHLHIARRLTDALYPGFRQLGSVWLPLPHLLMAPFAANTRLWQTGLAGAPPSMIAYIVGAAGMYRLARFALPVRTALIATLFFALNPGLLYLQTTAMTEPIFLAQMVWTAVFVAEHGRVSKQAPGRTRDRTLRLLLLGVTLVLVGAVYTRYDGWIFAAAAWCVVAVHTFRERTIRERSGGAFYLCTAALLAAPLSWLAYNAKQFGDPLDFMRGPYSAAAIDARTSAHGAGHYPGWHKMPIALLYFVKAAELNVTTYWLADVMLVLAIVGTVLAIRARRGLLGPLLLLWIPVPFYMYSVAYGSVPIFLPRWYPNGWYNTRYGMEMLPAFALSFAWAVEGGLEWITRKGRAQAIGYAVTLVMLLIVLNDVVLLRERPLVLGEATVNSKTRIQFESALAGILEKLPPEGVLLMSTADHPGALQQAGIPFRRTVNDADGTFWQDALQDPAHHAKYVVALDGDPVAKAVAAHGEGLAIQDVICTRGQPCARVYVSTEKRVY